jgi:hypothetical protein
VDLPHSIHDIREGNFMYMPPVARLFNAGQSQGHLVQVANGQVTRSDPGPTPVLADVAKFQG